MCSSDLKRAVLTAEVAQQQSAARGSERTVPSTHFRRGHPDEAILITADPDLAFRKLDLAALVLACEND